MRSPIHRVRRFSLDLLWCAARGHAITGLDASAAGADPLLLIETSDGQRLHRCLRCLAWVEHPAPITPSGPAVTIEGVRIPARGRALRDAFVLRLIAIDKAVHALLLTLVGVALLILSSDRAAAHDSFLRLVVALNGSSSTPDQVEHRLHGLLGRVDWLLRLHTGTLYAASGAVLAYAALNAVEATGLWRMRRWAEYLSAIATSVFLPIEIYELVDRVTVFRIGTLIVNVAIVAYLVYAKRLFGVRGGARREHEVRMADASWPAVRAEIARRQATGGHHEAL